MKNKEKFQEIKDWYLTNFKDFENQLNGHSETFYHEYRKNAFRKFKELNFPTLRDEEWKYTSIAPIMKHNFIPAVNAEGPNVEKINLDDHFFKDFEHHKLVFVNGIFNEELSEVHEEHDEVVITNLSNAIKKYPDLVKKYSGKTQNPDTAFGALNSVYSTDGVFVFVPENVILDKPVQILFINGHADKEVLSSPKNIFVAGKNSQAKIVTIYSGIEKNPYLTNVTNEVYTGENAVLDIYKIQNENENAFHIDNTDAHQLRTSVFTHFSASLGGSLSRNDVNSILDDEYALTNYFGLYLANGDQHMDNHTFVDHAKPNCESHELYKGILDDKARGVFNGKIMVRQDAQKTNAYQSNKAMLLSKEARIDTKPQLEIFADDVKCSHGATVGRLDDSAYFYIRSRGVPGELAKSMLIHAFVNDVVEKVKIEPLRNQLNHLIFEHLKRIEINASDN